jgi:hypothetical protein
VTVSYTGLTSPGGPGSLMTLGADFGGDYMGGFPGDTITFQNFADNGHTSQTYTNPSAFRSFGGKQSDTFLRAGSTYSLVSQYSFNLFTFTVARDIWGTTTLSAAAVPEPGSLALGTAGSLLVMLGGRRARKRRP